MLVCCVPVIVNCDASQMNAYLVVIIMQDTAFLWRRGKDSTNISFSKAKGLVVLSPFANFVRNKTIISTPLAFILSP